MPSIVELCNVAISHCGTRSKITAIDEGSPEANACLTHFDQARDDTLRGADWNFARLTVDLAALADPPARWAYKYAVPTDCLRIRRLNDVPMLILPETFWERAAAKDGNGAIIGVILTGVSPLSAIYTARVEDPNRWDVSFADAFGFGLASRICYELTGKDERAGTLVKMWAAKLSDAAADNANEGSQQNRTYIPESLAARGYDDGLSQYGQTWPTSTWPWA